MLTSRLDTYISKYGDFCANDNNNNDDNDTTDYFTPCACARGNNEDPYGTVWGVIFGELHVIFLKSQRRPS